MNKWRTLILLIGSVLLTGCLAVVVAGAAAGVIVYDRRSFTVLERDQRIFHVINKDIVTNPRFNDSRVVIVSFNQVVLLVGQAPSPALKTLAEKIARSTPNVRRVYNEISVTYPTSVSTRTKDSLITGQIRTQMLNKKGLESGSIRIVTENGIVYLMGIATREQADLAVSVARQVKSVRKVVKVFQYIV